MLKLPPPAVPGALFASDAAEAPFESILQTGRPVSKTDSIAVGDETGQNCICSIFGTGSFSKLDEC
jgi:hypothetical protein